ncbi:hypothetical protein RI543_004010 [Arxiozyma heterogenica]|uniref:Uncharacterized protein n=2 Tax=Arxiozyma heterogenica TaxID=278026 RepID=A0AAN7ZRN3_9SACH|nr:hypothetical protein RI543_004010 [Kazachstania heterogenica]
MKLQLKFLKDLKYYPQVKLPVSRDTPPANEQQLPKGLHGPILRFANSNNLYSQESLAYSCSYFKMRFYPTNHFLSLFRKTKPSITVQAMQMKSFLDDCQSKKVVDYLRKVYLNEKSVVPGDFAVWRRKITVKVKQIFIKEWYMMEGNKDIIDNINSISNNVKMNNKSIMLKELSKQYEGRKITNRAKDGYYMFFIYKYPSVEEMKLFQEHIRNAIRQVADRESQLENKKSNKNWVERANSKVNITFLNKLLVANECPYRVIKVK